MSIPSGQAVQSGKALEYAVAKDLEMNGVGKLIQSQELRNVWEAYDKESEEEKQWLNLRATIANEHLCSIEPRLREGGLLISVQPDRAGADGDVRDIVLTDQNSDWELGLSVKRKHEALKHSRLSPRIDFGQKWGLGQKCSQEYWDSVNPVFDRLRDLRQNGQPWPDQEEKILTIYRPVMEAFRTEIQRICDEEGKPACSAAVCYLVGRHDFYKVITQDDSVKIQAFNLNKKLTVGKNLKLPRQLVSNKFKKNGKDTIFGSTVVLIFDHGWTLSFRAHNASSKVESSLKLDILLQGQPANLYTHTISVAR